MAEERISPRFLANLVAQLGKEGIEVVEASGLTTRELEHGLLMSGGNYIRLLTNLTDDQFIVRVRKELEGK